MVEHCGSHYNYHLCERCFVDLFMWRSHYNTQICFKDGFMLVKMSPLDGGHDCYLAPVGQGDLGAVLDALEQDADERGLPFVIVSVAEPMIERISCSSAFTFSHDSEDDDYIHLRGRAAHRCPAKARVSATSSTASAALRGPLELRGYDQGKHQGRIRVPHPLVQPERLCTRARF
ncbi:MAG: hypothetical protein ACLSDM_05735 [Butyricicoccus sp.]